MTDVMSKQEPNYSGFVVIGAGLPRTGTTSLREALGILLQGKCHHMAELLNPTGSKDEAEFWAKVMGKNGELPRSEWVNFLQGRGFRAGVDFPMSMYYKQVMEAFPDAKVVLSLRDPEHWYESVTNTIYKMERGSVTWQQQLLMFITGMSLRWRVVQGIMRYTKLEGMQKSLCEAIDAGKEESVRFFNDWVKEAKRHVPQERLLVFEAKDGWEPLCKFLGVPVPKDIPYPRVNDTATMQKRLRKLQIAKGVLTAGAIILLLLLSYSLMRFLL